MAASWCKKFQANIFNKSKCQNCFRSKEQHSAEALESAKCLRKVSKCGYLFVAPETFDFNNPMDKTRRWQRRFFILYDDGELSYSVDENVGTVPQGVIDMNKCSDVHDAETTTTHQLSIAVKTPEKTTFIKGCDKHEIARWFDVLVMYPRSIKTKHRRTPTYSTPISKPRSDGHCLSQPVTTATAPTTSTNAGSSVAITTSASSSSSFSSNIPAGMSASSRGARRHTYHAPGWSADDEDDRDGEQEHICSSTSTITSDFHSEVNNGNMDVAYAADLDSDQGSSSLMRSRSDPRITEITKAVTESAPMTYRSVRSMKHKDRAYQEGMRKSNSMQDLSRPDTDPPVPDESLYRSRSRENLYGSFPKRRVVSDTFDGSSGLNGRHLSEPSSPTSSIPGDLKPKTFFESLHQSLLNPEPPKPKSKNSRYLRLASIPDTRTIDDYVGSVDEPDDEPSPRRSKSLDRPKNRRRESSPSPVANTRTPIPRSASSPRAKPGSITSSDKASYTNTSKGPSPSVSKTREWKSGLLAPNSHQSKSAVSGRSRSSDSITNGRASRSSATAKLGLSGSGTSVSLLARQWSSNDIGTDSPSSASMSGRTSRPQHRQTPLGVRRNACDAPARSPQHVSTSTPVSLQFADVTSPMSKTVASPGSTPTSKFQVRMPPPYRTAALSTSPTYSFPRTPFIGQEPSAQPIGRSLSAPSPTRSMSSTADSSRTSARSVERGRERGDAYTRETSSTSYILNGRTKNETDEYKMAKSGELAARINQHLADSPSKSQHQDTYDDLMYMKKGWLLKQDDQDWTKHWFVLSGTSLKYYQDSRAEEASQLDGCIDIADCYEVIETDVTRNYGFKLKTTSTGDHVLSAMTSGIRNNWMQAIQKCMESSSRPSHLDYNSRNSLYSTPQRSSPQRTDYSTPQRQTSTSLDSSRRHPQSAPPSAARALYPSEPGTHSPRSDTKSDSSGSRMSTPDSWSRGRRTVIDSFNHSEASGKSPSASPQQGRFVSCTWPYDSSSSGTSSSERDHTPDSHGSRSRRNSNVSQYLEDEDSDRKSKELTQEEEQELDNVERNIRRIHRKSISESVHKHRPQHFEKFETGAAFDDKDQPDSDKSSPTRSHDRSVTPSSRSSTPSSTPRKETPPRRVASPSRRRATETPERKTQTAPRAPSAKIKEKSRAKSPRPRSPPPLEAKMADISLDGRSGPSDDEILNEITEGRWKDDKHPRGLTSTSQPDLRSMTSGTDASVTGQEHALVELLETEVESLKTQLERTRSELSDSHQHNHDLKAQLRSSRRDHHELVSDLETDQTRYLTQIEDIQDQMEHTTEYLQTKLGEQEAQLQEQESHSELTKLQVQTLKKQLKEAKETTDSQEVNINSLREQLNNTDSEEARLQLLTEKEQLEKLIDDLESKVKALEEEIERLETQLHWKNKLLDEKEKNLHEMQDAIDQGEQTIMDMERDLEELSSLKQKVKDGVEKMADLEEELSALRSQLSEQDQELQVKDDIHRAKIQEVEQHLKNDKEKLESHIQDLEKQLDLIRRQSSMSDSLNSNMADILREKDETIAQLEEKLIENDAKIEELTDELALEIDENTQLQQNVDSAYSDNVRIKRDLDQATKDINQLEEGLESANQDLSELRVSEKKQREETDKMRRDLSKYQTEVEVLKHENRELREAVEDFKDDSSKMGTENMRLQIEQHHKENESFRQECAKLEEELNSANGKVIRLESQLTQQEQRFEKDLQDRHQELQDARKMASELESQLQATEQYVVDNQKIIEANMEAVTPFKGAASKSRESSAKRPQENIEDIRTKYERSVQEVKRLRTELREAHISVDDLEIAATTLKQQFRAMEMDYQQQLAMMSTRLQDLTNKLAAADKKVRKLERRAARRESKLKLRRDSLESPEKLGGGSSGETETEGQSDRHASDKVVMDLLTVVCGQTPSEVSAEDASDLNASSNSSNSKHEDETSISDTHNSDLLSLTDPVVTAKFKQLQADFETSEQKVKCLTKELELTTPEGQNKALAEYRKQNKEYEKQIIFLTASLNKSGASEAVAQAKAKRAASKDKDSPSDAKELSPDSEKLDASHSALDECRHKLAAVVQDLEAVGGGVPTTDNYSTTINSLRARLEKILKDTEGGDELSRGAAPFLGSFSFTPNAGVKYEPLAGPLGEEQRLHVFAEKLSLEASLVGEMAHLIRTGQDHMMSEREVYLHEIAEANHRILELEQKVQGLQYAQGSDIKDGTSGQQYTDSVTVSSGLLAEKMVLQGQIQRLLEKHQQQQQQMPSAGEKTGQDPSAIIMGQEALFKSRLSERLYSSSTNIYSMSFASQALVQGELTFVLNKLRERMADSRTDQERIDLLDHELELSHRRLCERANLMCDSVEAYKVAALDRVAATVLNNKTNKDQVDSEIAKLIKKSAADYRRMSVDGEHLGVMPESIPESRRHTMIEASIQQEIEETVEVLAERCQIANSSGSAQSEEDVKAVLRAVCEVLAQKSVIDGHIAYITEQIQQHQQQAPPAGQRMPNPLRRHDSGIMLHSSSLPTSPTAEDDSPDSSTDGEHNTLATHLENDAAARRDLAIQLLKQRAYLDDKSSGIKGQIAKIANDLVNVDVNLIRHKRLVSDYAEVIAQEAMFQAQISYLINKLKLEHEREIKLLQQQIDSIAPSDSMAGHVTELENEIHRLSCLLAENDELLKKEAAAAQERLAGLEEELQRQEDHFQQEVKNLEDRYKKRVKNTDRDLAETREELEKLQVEKQKELKEHEEVISTIEEELKETRSQLNQFRRDNDSGEEGTESKIFSLERNLMGKQANLDKLQQEHESQVAQYETHIATLEEEIKTLRTNHGRELRQAQEDMKMAMKAVSVQGTAKLEEEVKILHGKLHEERSRHVAELEKLRLELSEDAGVASQAILTSKIQHLEMQMENIQADYEQELNIQRSAHRRELNRSKDELLGLLAEAEAKSMHVDEGSIRKRYTKEIERIKEIYDRGFAAMEKSHQRVLKEMRLAHKRELEMLRSEKDQLLVEETKATQAALDAMRKAHEAEVQKERNKFLDAISKTYSHSDVEALQRQHEDDLDLIQNEIRQLSEQYSIKCLENAALDERLQMQTKALADSRKRVQELMARNEELQLRLRQDIERLNKLVKQNEPNLSGGGGHQDHPEVNNLKVALRVKAVDMQQMQDEIEALKSQLQGTTEELEDNMERYEELHCEAQSKQSLYEKQISTLRIRLDEVMNEDTESATSEATLSEGATSERSRGGSPDPEDEATDASTLTPEQSQDDSDDRVHSPGPAPSPRVQSRVMPNIPTDARNTKRMLWRQRQPQRCRSSPGPPSLMRRLSLPVEQTTPTNALLLRPALKNDSADEDVTASAASCSRTRKERSGRHTIVGVNVAPQVFPDKF